MALITVSSAIRGRMIDDKEMYDALVIVGPFATLGQARDVAKATAREVTLSLEAKGSRQLSVVDGKVVEIKPRKKPAKRRHANQGAKPNE